ncbi:hypothetical protein DL95DRAFT_399945 [Leptodontidium sp. 2 PMI_412]|nr:hypothetical protein DL95DRAFT_399945 [Leptodontidium sp. 2 PMI_412]
MSQDDHLTLDLGITLRLHHLGLFENEEHHPPPCGHGKTLNHPHNTAEKKYIYFSNKIVERRLVLSTTHSTAQIDFVFSSSITHIISSAATHSTTSFLSFTQIAANFSSTYQTATTVPKRSAKNDQEVGDLDQYLLDSFLNPIHFNLLSSDRMNTLSALA